MQKISEKNVASLWVSGSLTRFTDDMGNDVEVICVGRKSTRPGCDFQDVVLSVNREKLVGDVELHLSSDLWRKHGHHADPAYNGIILHVAMWQKGSLPVKLEKGAAVPTVILSGYITQRSLLGRRPGSQVRRSCPVTPGKSSAVIKGVLMQAGMRRFSVKSAKYAAALQDEGAEQSLYKGICRALGYSRNTAPFEALADRLPYDLIMREAAGSLVKKQAILLGTAGLLASQCGSICTSLSPEVLQNMRTEWDIFGDKPLPLPGGSWSFSFLRPCNHPIKRLVYLGHLLQKYEGEGLVGGFTGIFEAAPPGDEADCLERGLLVNDDVRLPGTGRAREMALNQLLPFLTACAVRDGNVNLATRAINTYLNYRPLPSNELLRYMQGQIGLARGINACLQQGMLHIYHSYCRVKDCSGCPVFTCRRPGRV